MITVGLGFRQDASCDEILGAIELAFAFVPAATGKIGVLATADFKKGSPQLNKAADELGVPVCYFGKAALLQTVTRLSTYSHLSVERAGVGSLCEAAALAAAGENATLLVPRQVCGPVTCAMAERGAA